VTKIVRNAEQVEKSLGEGETVILPRFFALAEVFRRLGEAHYATGQDVHGHSLLDPESTWRTAASLVLPRVDIDLPPLEDAEMKAALVK
jgi:hypothetical protein